MPANSGPQLNMGLLRKLIILSSAVVRYPDLLRELFVRIPGPIVERYYGWKDSRRILNGAPTTRKVLFVDGGAHVGGAFKFFSAYFPPGKVEYDVFEPNPNCLVRLKKNLADFDRSTVRFHPAALWTQSGSARLFGIAGHEGGSLSQGASIVQHQHSLFYAADPACAAAVPTIDFCEYIRSKRDTYDAIIVKLDVEGAEYDLLEALIECDLLQHIDTLYVEFHTFYLTHPKRGSEQRRQARLVAQLKASGTRLRMWH